MRIPRFWARANAEFEGRTTEAFGWSDHSAADAAREAQARATRVARWLADPENGDDPHRRYGYGDDRPLREPIHRELAPDRAAVVTRNAYGALVLNTASVCFIDVDLPEPPSGVMRLVRGLFARGSQDPAATALDRMRSAADRHGLSLRIYRTSAGFRCLVTNRLFDPADRTTDALLAEFGSDPRYRALCGVQRCFRARLTPKPWRCGVREPVWPWPFRSREHEEAHAAWVRTYERTSQAYAVCELVESRGAAAGDPRVASLVALVQTEHDRACLRGGNAALA